MKARLIRLPQHMRNKGVDHLIGGEIVGYIIDENIDDDVNVRVKMIDREDHTLSRSWVVSFFCSLNDLAFEDEYWVKKI